jgi:hypothetical protein
MNRTQRIRRRCAAILAALAAATWAGGAPAAFAAPVPPPGTSDGRRGGPLPPAHTAAMGGIHGWQGHRARHPGLTVEGRTRS